MDKPDKIDDGIFFVEKGQLSIGSLTMRFDDEGNVKADPIEIKMRFDVCPVWMEIAIEQLTNAKEAAIQLQKSKVENDSSGIGEALKAEMHAGMQTIVASCAAMEAFNSSIIRHCELSSELLKTWKEKKTAKYKKITEVIKIAFFLRNEDVKAIRNSFKEFFALRDKAVHPSQEYEYPALHQELNKRVDLKFAIFRYHNAKNIAEGVLSVLHQLSVREKVKNEEIKKYLGDLYERLAPVVEKWEATIGPLPGKKPNKPSQRDTNT